MNEKRIQHDRKILSKFLEVYCRAHHATNGNGLCDDCRALQEYAFARLAQCPLDPKPKCKNCPVHCYKPEYRQKIKEVMRFAGMHFVKRGRLDWMIKYFRN